MEEVIKDISGTAFLIAIGIGVIFLLFCCVAVWQPPGMPTRWGDVAWKRVDYIWIVAGSVTLIIQAVAMSNSAKLVALSVEESFVSVNAQRVNMDAARLSDSTICLPPGSSRREMRSDDVVELDEACSLFKDLRPDNSTARTLDPKVVRYHVFGRVSELGYSNPELRERVHTFNRSLDMYYAQKGLVRDLAHKLEQHKKALEILSYVSYVMLIVAVGVRLAKVKGEIMLKTNPISRTDGGGVSREEFSAAIDGLVSQVQLNILERKVSELEVLLRRLIYGVGGLIFVVFFCGIYIFVIGFR